MMYDQDMSKKWKVIYYEENNKAEVYDFIESLMEKSQGKILAWISLLEDKGPTLPRPYADLLGNGIHELRIKLTGDQIRILYFFCYEDYIVLTNYFVKTTDKVPTNEINKALKCKESFLKKYTIKNIEEQYNENI